MASDKVFNRYLAEAAELADKERAEAEARAKATAKYREERQKVWEAGRADTLAFARVAARALVEAGVKVDTTFGTGRLEKKYFGWRNRYVQVPHLVGWTVLREVDASFGEFDKTYIHTALLLVADGNLYPGTVKFTNPANPGQPQFFNLRKMSPPLGPNPVVDDFNDEDICQGIAETLVGYGVRAIS